MEKPENFRKLLNIMESLDERRVSFGSRGGKNTVIRPPIPYAKDAAGTSPDDSDWLRDAAFKGNPTRRVYIDHEHQKLPMVGAYVPEENAHIFLPDNGANTMSQTNYDRIAEILQDNGLKMGRDFTINGMHGILKIFGKKLPEFLAQ